MPQLMPLFWGLSFMVVVLFVMVMFKMYFQCGEGVEFEGWMETISMVWEW